MVSLWHMIIVAFGSLDTLRDKNLLVDLWESGNAPWKFGKNKKILLNKRVFITGHSGFKGAWMSLC